MIREAYIRDFHARSVQYAPLDNPQLFENPEEYFPSYLEQEQVLRHQLMNGSIRQRFIGNVEQLPQAQVIRSRNIGCLSRYGTPNTVGDGARSLELEGSKVFKNDYLYEEFVFRAQRQMQLSSALGAGHSAEKKRKQDLMRKHLGRSQVEELAQMHRMKNRALINHSGGDHVPGKEILVSPCSFLDDSSSESEWEVDVDYENDGGNMKVLQDDAAEVTWDELEMRKKPLTSKLKASCNSDNIQYETAQSFFEFMENAEYSGSEPGCESDSEDSFEASDNENLERAQIQQELQRLRRDSSDKRERDSYEFFCRMLQDEKTGLGKLYRQQRHLGPFVCLVCNASGKRWKNFSDLASVVQHAKTVSKKTNRRSEHRGYARAVSDFLILSNGFRISV